jgi:hypothetical protein
MLSWLLIASAHAAYVSGLSIRGSDPDIGTVCVLMLALACCAANVWLISWVVNETFNSMKGPSPPR